MSDPLLPLLWPQLTAQLLDVDVDGAVVVLLLWWSPVVVAARLLDVDVDGAYEKMQMHHYYVMKQMNHAT